MHRPLLIAAALAGLCACLLLPSTAHAAESYDNCSGTIASVPTVISSHSAATSGDLILVTTNNVTIDCNGFKLGGLSAGPTSMTKGISALDRNNVTVRNCDIRGFYIGIFMTGTIGGHLVEDNRLEGNLRVGIMLQGGRNIARRNRVYDTVCPTAGVYVRGIEIDGDAFENTVDGVVTNGDGATGIVLAGTGSVARGNTIRNLSGGTTHTGIDVYDSNAIVSNNTIVNETPQPGRGIWGTAGTFCSGNMVAGFTTEGIYGCDLVAGNAVH